MTQKCVALLGRKDTPTDAVEEYCQYLGAALREHDFDLRLVRCGWAEAGWAAALEELRKQSNEWRGQWVMVQYTALAWSLRGFPLRFLRVLEILERAGARTGIVFHDVEPYAGRRWVDALRRRAQLHVMQEALETADLAVFTVPMDKISWIGKVPSSAVFIPVGANLPASERVWRKEPHEKSRLPTIAVFGITGGAAGVWEMAIISEAAHFVAAQLGKVRVVAVGRNSETAEKTLGRMKGKGTVEVVARGVVPAEELAETLCAADVLLFVRGAISTRRGSAIAGIACGLPVVAFEGEDTAAQIAEAGVVFADMERQGSVGEALLRVLSDDTYRAELSERSRRAQEKYFSWTAVGEKYAEALRKVH